MAENEQNGIMEVVSSHVMGAGGETVIVTQGELEGAGVDGVNEEDLLQQALDEASGNFTAGQVVEYTHNDVENQIVNNVHEGTAFVTTEAAVAQEGVLGGDLQATTYTVVGSLPNAAGLTYQVGLDTSQSTSETDTKIYIADPSVGDLQPEVLANLSEQVATSELAEGEEAQMDSMQVQNAGDVVQVPSSLNVTLIPTNESSGAPLGSSLNPIRIIQQGNQYTPVQQLTTDQLQQIMQVVQQQQFTKSTAEGGSSILYNPQTNTRIVYRVIYPSELHKGILSSGESLQKQTQGLQTSADSVPKRVYKKRKMEEEERYDGPELTKEEKEAKKKNRPRTRSGRVSKPPKHMVQDYKHIHVLDWDEDYDDSDGGYSDIKVNHEDSPEVEDKETPSFFNTGIGSIRPKNWKCESCGRGYIGKAGLARHLRLNPDHGSVDDLDDEQTDRQEHGQGDYSNASSVGEQSNASTFGDQSNLSNIGDQSGLAGDQNNSLSLADQSNLSSGDQPNLSISESKPTPFESTNGVNNIASLSEDSRDSTSSLQFTPQPKPRGRGGRRGFRGYRGRWGHRYDSVDRRKSKLSELVKECADEELMEIVLPRLAKVITLWEFLLMKVEGSGARPRVQDIYREYEALHKYIHKMCKEYLQPLPDSQAEEDKINHLKIENSNAADGLGLKTGYYKVKDISEQDTTYQYKLLTTSSTLPSTSTKRTVEVVSPEQLISVSPNKGCKQPAVITTTAPVTFLSPSKTQAANSRIEAGKATAFSATKSVPVAGTSVKPQMSVANRTSSNIVTFVTQPKGTSASSGQVLIPTALVSGVSSPASAVIVPTVSSVSGVSLQPPVPATSVISVSLPKITHSSSKPTVTPTTVLVTNNMTANQQKPLLNNVLAPGASLLKGRTFVPSTKSLLTSSTVLSSHSTATSATTQSSNSLIVNSNLITSPVNSANCVNSSTSAANKSIVHSGKGNKPVTTTVTGSRSVSLLSRGLVSASPTQFTVAANNSGFLTPITPKQTSSDAVMVRIQGSTTDVKVKVEDEKQDKVEDLQDPHSNSAFVVTSLSAEPVKGSVEMLNSEVMTQPSAVSSSALSSQDISLSEASSREIVNGVVNSNSLETGVVDQSEGMAAVLLGNGVEGGSEQTELVQLQTDAMEDTDQVEAIQIPATNIFQTEDGIIIIQNPDGTTVQLQGTDGQSIPLETVQALLAMDGETQFITEPMEIDM